MIEKQEPFKYLDDEEREIIEAWERGEFKPVPNQAHHRRIAMQAARNYLRKDKRINIRLSEADLSLLKRRAATEGMPYQTLVSSVLHKFVTGQLS